MDPPFLLGVVLLIFMSIKLHMNNNELKKKTFRCTLRKSLKGTNRVVHAHFHAG